MSGKSHRSYCICSAAADSRCTWGTLTSFSNMRQKCVSCEPLLLCQLMCSSCRFGPYDAMTSPNIQMYFYMWRPICFCNMCLNWIFVRWEERHRPLEMWMFRTRRGWALLTGTAVCKWKPLMKESATQSSVGKSQTLGPRGQKDQVCVDAGSAQTCMWVSVCDPEADRLRLP